MNEDLTKLQRILKGLSAVITDKFTKELPNINKSTVDLAKSYSPVDTGKLRGSIEYAQVGLKSYISTDTPYSQYVLAVNPFIQRAIDNNADKKNIQIENIMYDTIRTEVEK